MRKHAFCMYITVLGDDKELSAFFNMNHVMRKPVFGVSDQVQHNIIDTHTVIIIYRS